MFDASVLTQLAVLGLLGLVMLVAAYSLPQKIAATLLLVIIPVQPIDTKYFTANVALTYILFIAMLMRGENIRLPLLPQIALLLFAYLVSMGQCALRTRGASCTF